MRPLSGRGLHGDGLLREAVEQLPPPARGPAVEPERELVQVGVQVRHRDTPLMDAQQPPLEQGRDPVDARQQVLPNLGFLTDDLVGVAERVELAVPMLFQPASEDSCYGLHHRL